MKSKICILFLFLLLTCLLAQDTVQVFKIFNCQLKCNNYLWGDELSLSIQGRAMSYLKGGSLKVSLFYDDQFLQEFPIILTANHNREIDFSLTIERINEATADIFAGIYKVTIELIMANQPQQVAEKLQSILQGKTIQNYSIKETIGTPEQNKQQRREMRNLCLELLKQYNLACDELFLTRKTALSPRLPKNPFYKNRQFDHVAWRVWCLNFIKRLESYSQQIKNYKKSINIFYYTKTYKFLLFYHSMLLELTQTYANAIYQAHQTPQFKYNEPYNYTTLYKKLQFLRSTHQEVEKELKVDLKTKLGLGYFPPPPIFRHF